jgi:hypothetical protein
MVSAVTIPAERRPAPLRWAVRLLAAEAVVAGLYAVFLGYLGVTEPAADAGSAWAVTAYAALIAAALAGVAFALSRRKARARAPAIVLQLLGVVAAYGLTATGLWWLSVPVALAALLVITLLLTPSATAALAGSPPAAR